MSESNPTLETTKLVIGVWPVIGLVAIIFAFFFLTVMSHVERITKNETNVQNIASIICKIDKNVETLMQRKD